MDRRIKVMNICLTAVLSVGFILLAVFVFGESYIRFCEACVDLFNAGKYYVNELFGTEYAVDLTFNRLPETMRYDVGLPTDWNNFTLQMQVAWKRFISKDNLVAWGGNSLVTMGNTAKVLVIVVPLLVVLYFVLADIYRRPNNKYNEDTKPLKWWKVFENNVLMPFIRYLKQYYWYITSKQWIVRLWLVLWAFSLNLASIAVAFVAYYLYFAVSFDVVHLYMQVCRLAVDLQVILTKAPLLLVALAVWMFCRWRAKAARNGLRHMEARNCGLINELPIVSMACGSMGKKKTTCITDMALSQEVMFRQEALSRLQKWDMRFPYFPWILFELDLRAAMDSGKAYNLATVRQWVDEKRASDESGNDELYGYDYERYGVVFDDKLKVVDVWTALRTYAQLYFIYVIESSLIVSNYSIRTDNLLMDGGNFPLWNSNFFPDCYRNSRFAHILDFDLLRLGKKVSDKAKGCFEFGVINITEVGKERGNNLELREVKKSDEVANQKNDMFNAWLKMCRHAATVDYFPFVKVFCDEQRPESWGADARDLCDIIQIVGSSEQGITLPFYTLEEMVYAWVVNRFLALYYELRYLRGDNTLLVYLFKKIATWAFRRNMRMYNKYGYCVVSMEKRRGTMDGKAEKKKYFLMNRKIYAERASTDCFSDYFNELAKDSTVGLNDYPEYTSVKATVAELKQQNSYFINALYTDEDDSG